MYDFDRIIDRKNTNCVKWDSLTAKYGENDIIPMGIADMDFITYPGITEAVIRKASEGTFGYYFGYDELKPLIRDYYNKRGYGIEAEDVVLVTGVVHALDFIVRTFSEPGDGIMIARPYYPPHRAVVDLNKRRLVMSDLVLKDGRYEFDWEAIERDIEGVKLFILCQPHNPVGRIFSCEEIGKLADICKRHNVMIVSDEIHSDFAVRKDFVPACKASEYIKNEGITVTSLTKTFSIPGLKIAYCFIHNEQLRHRFEKQLGCSGLDSINTLGVEACKTALTMGEEWEGEMLEYIRENCHYTAQFIKERIPSVRLVPNEGTYLLWLDMRELNVPEDQLFERLIKEARIQLNEGSRFGMPGFMRMNVALPRSLLKEALERLERFVNSL